MTRLLVTGADGFVGRWLVRAARGEGRHVIAATLPGVEPPIEWGDSTSSPPVEVVRADFRDIESVIRLENTRPDEVVHLAAIASGTEASANPDEAQAVNGAMTGVFAETMSQATNPRFLYVSTGEVYGAGHRDAIDESAGREPVSPYASSKARGEALVGLFHSEDGLPAIIARPFPHTGPGQTTTYVLPSLASRLRRAKRAGAPVVKAGNLSAVRDFLDVRDVVRAYLLLLDRGAPGEVYNVASGIGRRLSDCFDALARIVGVDARAEQDAALLRPGDIPVLIGDATKLRTLTGWSPQIPFERTLQEMVDAQAD